MQKTNLPANEDDFSIGVLYNLADLFDLVYLLAAYLAEIAQLSSI